MTSAIDEHLLPCLVDLAKRGIKGLAPNVGELTKATVLVAVRLPLLLELNP